MNYTYTLIIEEEKAISSTTLNRGIEYFMITIQLMKGSNVVLLNDQTGRVILAYTPGDELGVVYASTTIKED